MYDKCLDAGFDYNLSRRLVVTPLLQADDSRDDHRISLEYPLVDPFPAIYRISLNNVREVTDFEVSLIFGGLDAWRRMC